MTASKKGFITADIKCKCAHDDVQKLPITEQAEMAYQLFGKVADSLIEFGFDPGMVEQACHDMALDLYRLDGSPPKVHRVDPRRVRRA